jgi:hypothetical protein
MQSEQELVKLQESSEEPIVTIPLPLTSWHDTLGELYFAQFQTEKELDRIKYVIDTIETHLIDLDLPLCREDYEQRSHPENTTYKDLGLILDSEPMLFSTPENN